LNMILTKTLLFHLRNIRNNHSTNYSAGLMKNVPIQQKLLFFHVDLTAKHLQSTLSGSCFIGILLSYTPSNNQCGWLSRGSYASLFLDLDKYLITVSLNKTTYRTISDY
jgi:hypothetical protein